MSINEKEYFIKVNVTGEPMTVGGVDTVVVDAQLGDRWWHKDITCCTTAVYSANDIVNEVIGMQECSCFREIGNKTLCFGTKEIDECSCGGNQCLCSFYPEKRINPKTEMQTEIEYYNVLKNIFEMNYSDILDMFGLEEYGAVEGKNEAIGYIVNKWTPKETIAIYDNYKQYRVVNECDVIEYKPDGKRYYITVIENGNRYYMLADDLTVRSIEYVKTTMPIKDFTKLESNVRLQDFIKTCEVKK